MVRYGGFAKEHLPPALVSFDCESCGSPVFARRYFSARVASVRCADCVVQGPAGQRRAERLARGKGGRNR